MNRPSNPGVIHENNKAGRRQKKLKGHPDMTGREDEWCAKCSAVFHKKQWVSDPALHAEYQKNARGKALCPKHEMISAHRSEGELIIAGLAYVKNRQDLLNLIHNLGVKSVTQDSQDAIISEEITENTVHIHVSDDQLATRMGKKITEAFPGTKKVIKRAAEENYAIVHLTLPK